MYRGGKDTNVLTGQIILQIVVILLAVQLCGNLCKLVGQQWVIGEILAGIVLGPSVLGALLPNVTATLFPTGTLPTLQTLGDLGLVLYMFALGARLDTNLMIRQSREAVVISFSGILLPLIMGGTLGFFLFPALAGSKATLFPFMLLVGTAMSITAFPVLARLLMEKRMLQTKMGMLALTSASIDDVIAWCMLALLIALMRDQGGVSSLLVVGETALFSGVMLFVLRPLLRVAVRKIHSVKVQITMAIAVLLLASYTTTIIGIHPIFGAFLAGVILPRNVAFTAHIRGLDQVNTILFLPLFFVFSGLRTRIGLLDSPALWGICALVFVIACGGKMLSGTLATRLMKAPWKDAFGLGLLLNTRGLVELIVLNIGLELNVLSPTLFAMLVLMALTTTMMATPLLSLSGHDTGKAQEVSEPEILVSEQPLTS
jgi:Kef-type K+ transport system membrane component KefB